MATVICLAILAFLGKLSSVNTDVMVSSSIIGVLLEVALIWVPIVNRKEWLHKMSYFKYLKELFF